MNLGARQNALKMQIEWRSKKVKAKQVEKLEFDAEADIIENTNGKKGKHTPNKSNDKKNKNFQKKNKDEQINEYNVDEDSNNKEMENDVEMESKNENDEESENIDGEMENDSENENNGENDNENENDGEIENNSVKSGEDKKEDGEDNESVGSDDFADLTTDNINEDKIKMIEQEAPDLLKILEDMKEKTVGVKERIEMILESIDKEEFHTSSGISFLDAKFNFLICYLVNLVFYLLRKSNGKSVKDSPVIMQLLRIKTFLERMSHVDSKLKYQVERLCKLALNENFETEEVDKLGHKANLKHFAIEEGEEALVSDTRTGKYVPPKRLGHEMLNSKEKQLKQEMRNKSRAKNSAMAKMLLEKYGSEPIAVSAKFDNEDTKERRKENYMDHLEEKNFMRQMNQPVKKKERIRDGLETLENVSDISKLLGDYEQKREEEDLIEEFTRKRAYEKFIDSENGEIVEERKPKRQRTDSGNKEGNKEKFQNLRKRNSGNSRGRGRGRGRGRTHKT